MARTSKVPLASADDIEQQFYEAFQRGDVEAMMAVWADDDDVACVHPGGPRIVGPGAIRAGFEAIFAHGGVNATPEKVRRVQLQGGAVHHVLERVQAQTSEGPQSAWVLATNVYVKTAQGWRMVLHHASRGSPHEAQEVGESASTLH
jgi:ketosteroid isomerase-like protein